MESFILKIPQFKNNDILYFHGSCVRVFSASSSAGDIQVPDLKYGFEELCPVCGDKVSGYHYGLLTCESCKGELPVLPVFFFFK